MITGTTPPLEVLEHSDLEDMPDVTNFTQQDSDHDPRYNIVIDGGDIGIDVAMDYLRRMILDGGEL